MLGSVKCRVNGFGDLSVGFEHARHLGVLVAQAEFEHAVLERLKAGRLAQAAAKARIVEGRHGGEDFPGLDQLHLHARDPRHHLEGRAEFVGADLAGSRPAISCRQSLIQNSLAWWMTMNSISSCASGQRPLAGQQVLQPQIVAIGHRLAEIPMDLLARQIDGSGRRAWWGVLRRPSVLWNLNEVRVRH